jgi:hypothetical protein
VFLHPFSHFALNHPDLAYPALQQNRAQHRDIRTGQRTAPMASAISYPGNSSLDSYHSFLFLSHPLWRRDQRASHNK